MVVHHLINSADWLKTNMQAQRQGKKLRHGVSSVPLTLWQDIPQTTTAVHSPSLKTSPFPVQIRLLNSTHPHVEPFGLHLLVPSKVLCNAIDVGSGALLQRLCGVRACRRDHFVHE